MLERQARKVCITLALSKEVAAEEHDEENYELFGDDDDACGDDAGQGEGCEVEASQGLEDEEIGGPESLAKNQALQPDGCAAGDVAAAPGPAKPSEASTLDMLQDLSEEPSAPVILKPPPQKTFEPERAAPNDPSRREKLKQMLAQLKSLGCCIV